MKVRLIVHINDTSTLQDHLNFTGSNAPDVISKPCTNATLDIDQTSEKLRYAEKEGLKICDATANPTKDYQRPLGMVYSPGREKLEKPILHKQDEYCFKCHFNTGGAFLDNCHHCNTDSFIGCGYKIEWKDDDHMSTGSSFYCCYCGSLHRDIAYTYEVDSDKMMLASNIIAEWVSKQNKTVSSARRQYEAKVANNNRTVNKHSVRLYGNDNDDSTQLAVCIYNLHWNTKESKEHVCPECNRIYKDVIDLTTQYNPICIDCAAVSFYNSRGPRMWKETSMIFHYHRYNEGFYPDSQNYVDGGFCLSSDIGGYPAVVKNDLWDFYFSDHWPYKHSKKCCFISKDSKKISKSSDIEAYYIYDNEYTTSIHSEEQVEVYIHWMLPLGRKIAMLFYKCPGYSISLKMVTIEQYADMVKCR